MHESSKMPNLFGYAHIQQFKCMLQLASSAYTSTAAYSAIILYLYGLLVHDLASPLMLIIQLRTWLLNYFICSNSVASFAAHFICI